MKCAIAGLTTLALAMLSSPFILEDRPGPQTQQMHQETKIQELRLPEARAERRAGRDRQTLASLKDLRHERITSESPRSGGGCIH